MYKYKRKDKITASSAEMIILENMAYSNYQSMEILNKRAGTLSKAKLQKIYNYNNKKTSRDEAMEGTSYSHRFEIENILDFATKWQGGGFQPIKIVDGIDYPVEIQKGADVIAMISYEAIFEDSYSAFEMASDNTLVTAAIPLFITAVNKGIAAIEASIRDGAETYNMRNPEKMLIDNFKNKVSFLDKIDNWIPEITGKKLDKSTIVWGSFIKLKKLRDDKDQHFKGSYSFNGSEILKLMNIYKYGIAHFLFDLDRLFNRRTSSLIIRAKYFPEITIDKN